MRISDLQKRLGFTAVAGGLLIASGTSPITFGDDGPPLLLSSGKVGDLLQFTVTNPGNQVRSGSLVVEMVLDGRRTQEVIPVTVWGGQKIFVSLEVPSTAASLIQAGIIVDDGAPI
jgi:hypothetical protein